MLSNNKLFLKIFIYYLFIFIYYSNINCIYLIIHLFIIYYLFI